MNKRKSIIAFAGSSSKHSINLQLVRATVTAFDEYDVQILDLHDFEMPIYSIDREKEDGIPERAHNFRQIMLKSNAIICSMSEHNRGITVAFKNIMDWCSRIDMNLFGKRPMLLMSTSPGGFGGGNSLNYCKNFFPNLGAHIVSTFSLPSFHKNFQDGQIMDEVLRTSWQSQIDAFKQYLNK